MAQFDVHRNAKSRDFPLVIDVQCGPLVVPITACASNVFHTPPPAVAT